MIGFIIVVITVILFDIKELNKDGTINEKITYYVLSVVTIALGVAYFSDSIPYSIAELINNE